MSHGTQCRRISPLGQPIYHKKFLLVFVFVFFGRGSKGFDMALAQPLHAPAPVVHGRHGPCRPAAAVCTPTQRRCSSASPPRGCRSCNTVRRTPDRHQRTAAAPRTVHHAQPGPRSTHIMTRHTPWPRTYPHWPGTGKWPPRAANRPCVGAKLVENQTSKDRGL